MVLKGTRVCWLERLPLPAGVCERGLPQAPIALGDLLGDWLLERGYAPAQVWAVLPPDACSWHVLPWRPGMDRDCEGEAVDVLIEPLQTASMAFAIEISVSRNLLMGWVAVCQQAEIQLVGLTAAVQSQWNGLLAALGPERWLSCEHGFLVQLGWSRSWLLTYKSTHPYQQQQLPGLADPDGLTEALHPLMASNPQSTFWAVVDGCWQLDDVEEMARLQRALPMPLMPVTTLPAAFRGVSWLLWGLVAPHVCRTQASHPAQIAAS